MNKKMSLSVIFAIGPSVTQKSMTALIHGVALLACWQNSLSVVYQLILTTLLFVSLFIQLSDYNKKDYKRLRFSEHSGWELAIHNDLYLPIKIGGASVITSWILVLYCISEHEQQIITVFNDALSDREYRKLLALIKTSGL